MAPYLGYWWVVPILIATGGRWKQLSLALMRILAVVGPTDRVRKRAFEVLRLDNEDAGHISSYLPESDPVKPAVSTATDQKKLGSKRSAEISASRTLPHHPQINR